MGRRKSLSERHQATLREAGPPRPKRGALADLQLPLFLVLPFATVIGALFVAALATGGLSSRHARAAIVDQLGLTAQNPGFVKRATQTLEDAGYEVDYYPGDRVSVNLYRYLQTRSYDLIIFRAHSSRVLGEWRGKSYDEVALWTSEPYRPALYVDEQADLRLGPVLWNRESPAFTGITAGFIRSSMLGSFEGTTIIMMGCNGLTSDVTAEAFLARGADAVVGWDGDVSSIHTDVATDQLLELLVEDGVTTDDAVSRTADRVGADPLFGGELRVLDGRDAVRSPLPR